MTGGATRGSMMDLGPAFLASLNGKSPPPDPIAFHFAFGTWLWNRCRDAETDATASDGYTRAMFTSLLPRFDSTRIWHWRNVQHAATFTLEAAMSVPTVRPKLAAGLTDHTGGVDPRTIWAPPSFGPLRALSDVDRDEPEEAPPEEMLPRMRRRRS